MRSPRSTRSTASVLLLALILAPLAPPSCARLAHAASTPLTKGQPAPYDGLLLDGPAAAQAVEDARDAVELRDVEKTMQATVETLAAKLRDMQFAVDQYQSAEKIHAQSDALRDAIEQRMDRQLKADERALLLMEKAAVVSIAAAEQSNKALTAANEKIEAANSRGFWGTVLAFVVGIFAGPAAAAFVR